MREADDVPDGFVYDAVDQLRHDLRSALTTIHGRAYLLGRGVRRASALSDVERARMLAGVAAIEAAVREMALAIDGIGSASSDGATDTTERQR